MANVAWLDKCLLSNIETMETIFLAFNEPNICIASLFELKNVRDVISSKILDSIQPLDQKL